jgi:inorganic pyrophosphatase
MISIQTRGASIRGVNRVFSSNYIPFFQQLHLPTAAAPTFTLAPSNPTHKNSPHSRTSQIARHFTSNNTTTNTANMASQYSVRKVGAPNTLEHRIYIEKDGQPVSPFHDIPLYANESGTVLNMVVEIPRWTNGKLEVSS